MGVGVKDDRGVLLVATVRGLEPIDRQRFAAGFWARHEASRRLDDGLVHAFATTRVATRMDRNDDVLTCEGWATFCASSLSHAELPGAPCPLEDITCVACMAGLLR